MDEGTKFILGTIAIALIGVLGFFYMMIDPYIPSARLELAVQGATAEQAKYRMEEALRGCRHARFSESRRYREYRHGSIGTFDRSFPALRNDKGWLAGTQVHCDAAACTVTASALIASPRESGSCAG